MQCVDILGSHEKLGNRRKKSDEQRGKVALQLSESKFLEYLPLSIFCAGSLARKEVGSKSDLDIFVIANPDDRLRSRLCEYRLFAELIKINDTLGLPPFSNDGEYLKIHFIDELKRQTGAPRDDTENSFTTRMLLILESQPIFGENLYNTHLHDILYHYYRDQKGKRSFKPLFLLNDILRYWRTLCLNYEQRRDSERPWRKKNINLKFSRMLTVFSTVLPLIAEPLDTVEKLKSICRITPLERLAHGLDILGDTDLNEGLPEVLDIYESFLGWKEDEDIEKCLEDGDQKKKVNEYAERFSTYLYRALTHNKIPPEFCRYLTL